MDRAAAGDRDARRELFERYREPAYRVAFRVTGRSEDALDVVQDSFIKAFEGLSSFQRESGFKTWFLRIVTNHALDFLRARKVRATVGLARAGEDGSADPLVAFAEAEDRRVDRAAAGVAAELERKELARRLADAVRALPPEQRAVFALYASGDLTYGQIAEIVGVPIGTVMSRLFHARRKLQEMLPDLAPRTAAAERGGDHG